MKSIKRVLALVLSLVLALGAMTACKKNDDNSASKDTKSSKKTEIVVLAAASLTDVTAKLKEMYEKNNNVKLTFSYGSSGALMTQIEEGAPADIFMSAANKQMNELKDKNLMNNDTIVELLENKVVLIVPKDSKASVSSFDDVASSKVSQVALGEPGSVPVGQYSEEIFTSLNILDKVKSKAVYGSDVRAVLSYVESGNVDCGVVYATDAMTTKNVKVICSAPEGSCKKVIYPVGVVKSSKVTDESKKFIEFLQSDEAKAVFEEYGFSSVSK